MEKLTRYAPLAVSSLIATLAYGSQALFYKLDRESLDYQQVLVFNVLVICSWICYARCCLTDPGHISHDWYPDTKDGRAEGPKLDESTVRSRWCRKCEAFKPLRAHHCKTCQR